MPEAVVATIEEAIASPNEESTRGNCSKRKKKGPFHYQNHGLGGGAHRSGRPMGQRNVERHLGGKLKEGYLLADAGRTGSSWSLSLTEENRERRTDTKQQSLAQGKSSAKGRERDARRRIGQRQGGGAAAARRCP